MFSSNTSGPGVAATDPQFNYVTMLLHGNGTNGAQNNTFLDSSTNNFTITRNGNTTQGTFSPFGNNWSNYFDGSGDYLSFTKQTTTSAFTCECWFYRGEDVSGYHIVFSGNNLGSVNADNAQLSVSNAGAVGLTLAGTAVIAQTGTAVIKNQWNHIAWVRSGTSCAIFVNGSRIATGTSSSALNVVSVGTYLSGYEPNGYVSNARINTTAVYDPSLTTCTVPTAPLTAITGTYLLTCQSNRFVDNSASPLTITVNGNPSVQRFSPFNPTAPYAASTDGGSGYFDASGDYLAIASGSTAVAIGTGDFTIECWYYPAAAVSSDVATLFSSTQSDSGSTIGLNLNVFDDRKVYIRGSFPTSNTVTVGAWNHIVASRVSGTTRIFINGVLGSSNSDSNNYVTNGCLIGARNIGSIYAVVNGYICDMKVTRGSGVTSVTVPTTPATNSGSPAVLCNFTNAGIIDNAEMNNLETVGNAQISTAQSKFGGGSMAFDGSGDGLYAPSNQNFSFGSGNFTIEFWLYYSSLTGYQTIASNGYTPNTANGWVIQTGNGDGKVNFYRANGSGSTLIASDAGSTISTATWYHIAIVRNGTTTTIYRNGVSVGSGTDSSTYSPASANFYVGGGSDTGFNNYYLNGYIDDLRITKGYARYTANFTPPSAPFPDQ
jgi:hypothetical protein